MRTIRILTVVDHPVFRRVLGELLSFQADIEVVGEIDGRASVAERVLEMAPEVVLVDMNLIDVGGLAVSRSIKEASPSTHVVILAEESSRVYQQAIRDAGASLSLRKAEIATELVAWLNALRNS